MLQSCVEIRNGTPFVLGLEPLQQPSVHVVRHYTFWGFPSTTEPSVDRVTGKSRCHWRRMGLTTAVTSSGRSKEEDRLPPSFDFNALRSSFCDSAPGRVQSPTRAAACVCSWRVDEHDFPHQQDGGARHHEGGEIGTSEDMDMRSCVSLSLLLVGAAAEPSTWTWYTGSTCSGPLVTDMSWGILPAPHLPNPTAFAAGGTCRQFGNDPDAVWSVCTNGVVTTRQYKGPSTAYSCTGAEYGSWIYAAGLPIISDGDCVSVDLTAYGGAAVSYQVTCIPPSPPPSPSPSPPLPPPQTGLGAGDGSATAPGAPPQTGLGAGASTVVVGLFTVYGVVSSLLTVAAGFVAEAPAQTAG